MSQFYKKYKNLFIKQEPTIKQYNSYIKPNQANMVRSFNSKSNNKIKQIHEVSYNASLAKRFETQILPQLNRLNKKNQNHRVPTQVFKPIYYTPEISNKYKNLEKISNISNSRKISDKSNEKFRQRFYRIQNNRRNTQISVTNIQNPQQTSHNQQRQKRAQANQNSFKSYHKIKTEPADIQIQRPIFPKIDNTRKDYGYPQTNLGLVFSQHSKQNQFQLINNRIKDIRWIQKFYPRGNINSYREALMRRKQCKDNLNQRRSRLKNLMAEQYTKYSKKAPII